MSRSIRLASAGLVATAILGVAACGSSSSSGGVAGATGTPATSFAAPSGSAPASAPSSVGPSSSAGATGSGSMNQAFLQFEPQNGSNISGGAILTDLGNGSTAVTIGVVAAGITDPMPASIVTGDCAAPGSPAPPAPSASGSAAPAASASAAMSLEPGQPVRLGDLTAGASNTVVPTTLDSLLATPYAIAIYKVAGDDTTMACADIKR
jgi:hypothetical protein